MPNRMHRESGYDHFYPLGSIVICQHGSGVITGVRIRKDMGKMPVYYFTPDNTREEKVVFETEILGYCTNVERHRTQTERIPGL